MKYLVTKDEFSMISMEAAQCNDSDFSKHFIRLPADKSLYEIDPDYEFPKLEKDELLEQYYIELEMTKHLRRIKESRHNKKNIDLSLYKIVTPTFTQNYEIIECDSEEEAILFYELY